MIRSALKAVTGEIKNDLREQVIGITNLLALTIADEGEAHKGDSNLENDLYMEDETHRNNDVYIWPTLEEQLAEVGMSIRDFI